METEEILLEAEERMENAVEALHNAFGSVRTGRASGKVLDRIRVDYYGAMTPINQLAGVKAPDAHLLVIEPWDKSSLKSIERAIMESDLGVTPMDVRTYCESIQDNAQQLLQDSIDDMEAMKP